MNIRTWSNLTLMLAILSGALAVIILDTQSKDVFSYTFYAFVVITVGYFAVMIYRSSDKKQIELKLKEIENNRYNVFEKEKYVVAVQTIKKPLTKISLIVDETFGKDELEEMLDFLEQWKNENNFKWDHTTLYDELLIEMELDERKGGIKYNINHKKNTNTFTIKGILLKEVVGDDEETKNEEHLYSINGLTFSLTNVLPQYVQKNGEWTLSTKSKSEGKYEEGMITNAIILD